jgi:hypothetical protein
VDQDSPRKVCGGRNVPGPISLNFDVTLSYHSTSAEVCLHVVHDRYRLHVSGRNIKIGRTSFEKPTLRWQNNVKNESSQN